MNKQLVVAVVLMGLVGCGGVQASLECGRDADCKGDRVCNQGQCVGPGSTGGGSGGVGGGTGGSGGGGAGGSGTGGTCCINSAFYDCATKAAFEQCTGGDLAGCHAACSASDFECHIACDMKSSMATHDPSACTRDMGRDSQCSSGGGCTIGKKSCSFDSDCPSGQACNNAVSRCFDVEDRCVGTACSFDQDCAKGEGCNDGEGKCFKTSESQTGRSCKFNQDCGPSSCSNGRCT